MSIIVRVTRHLDSETIHLPEVKELVGKDVEIVVRDATETTPEPDHFPLRGSVIRFDDPFAPVAEEDWEALE
jgi:hypothetical protein